MTDSEDAALCEISYTALLMLPHWTKTRLNLQPAMAGLCHEIARLRGRNPEDVQNDFERRIT